MNKPAALAAIKQLRADLDALTTIIDPFNGGLTYPDPVTVDLPASLAVLRSHRVAGAPCSMAVRMAVAMVCARTRIPLSIASLRPCLLSIS